MNMKADLVEKVAKQIWDANNQASWTYDAGVAERETYRRMARAAIRALMEPTEEMRRAGVLVPEAAICYLKAALDDS